MLCILKACWKCCGDLVLDGDEWRCWQCGRYYYPMPAAADPPPESVGARRLSINTGNTGNTGRNGPVRREHTRRSTRDINTVITAKDRSERHWWRRNGDVIRYLDEGRTVREISVLIGRGQRQIRVIRERLNDIRACELDVSRAANTI